MRRRGLLLVTGVALLPAHAFAQARRTLAPGEILRGGFIQLRYLKGFDKPLRTSGDFLLVPGRGLIWRAESPFAMVTIITPGGLIQQIDGRETMHLPAARVPALARLYDMFSASLAGNWSVLESQFNVVRSGDDRQWTIALKPRSEAGSGGALPIKSVELKGGAFLDEARIDKPDGDWDHLQFQRQSLSSTPLTAADAALLAQAAR